MNVKNLIAVSICSGLLGLILFAYAHNIIIIRYPFSSSHLDTTTHLPTITKKKVTLHYWHNNSWNNEETELLWSSDKAENIRYLINNLLALMHEEEALSKKITCESVMLCPTGNEAFLSLDRNPFCKESSTFEKWMIIESILKTIHGAEIPIQSVRFLVHHKPLHDYHLDFTNSWAIQSPFLS